MLYLPTESEIRIVTTNKRYSIIQIGTLFVKFRYLPFLSYKLVDKLVTLTYDLSATCRPMYM